MTVDQILQQLESSHPTTLGATRLLGNPGWWSFRLGRRERLVVKFGEGVEKWHQMTHERYNKVIGRGRNSRL